MREGDRVIWVYLGAWRIFKLIRLGKDLSTVWVEGRSAQCNTCNLHPIPPGLSEEDVRKYAGVLSKLYR